MNVFDMLQWSRRQKAGSPRNKLVLMILTEHADLSTGICWPRLDVIAEQAEIGKSTVQRAIGELEEAGLIEKQGRRPNGGPVIYRVCFGASGQIDQSVPSGHNCDQTEWSPVTSPVEPFSERAKETPNPSPAPSSPDLVEVEQQQIEIIEKPAVTDVVPMNPDFGFSSVMNMAGAEIEIPKNSQEGDLIGAVKGGLQQMGFPDTTNPLDPVKEVEDVMRQAWGAMVRTKHSARLYVALIERAFVLMTGVEVPTDEFGMMRTLVSRHEPPKVLAAYIESTERCTHDGTFDNKGKNLGRYAKGILDGNGNRRTA